MKHFANFLFLVLNGRSNNKKVRLIELCPPMLIEHCKSQDTKKS